MIDEPKFYHNQRVKINKGFYRNSKGYVYDVFQEKTWFGKLKERRYLIYIPSSYLKLVIYESSLEACDE